MIVARLQQALRCQRVLLARMEIDLGNVAWLRRRTTHFRSGALKPEPAKMPFGLIGVFAAVVPGLLIGAAISKSVANFLEENDLFVPSDDDDDED